MTEPISLAEYLRRLQADAEAGDEYAQIAWQRWQEFQARHEAAGKRAS